VRGSAWKRPDTFHESVVPDGGKRLGVYLLEIFGSSEQLPMIGREFLEASIAARKRALEAKQREQRGRQRLLAAAAAVFAILAVVASVAAIFGFWHKGEADKQAQLATLVVSVDSFATPTSHRACRPADPSATPKGTPNE
jgi:ABC-type transport system involved in cytochrome bd biosynthesis fused ATPase/permease subunit